MRSSTALRRRTSCASRSARTGGRWQPAATTGRCGCGMSRPESSSALSRPAAAALPSRALRSARTGTRWQPAADQGRARLWNLVTGRPLGASPATAAVPRSTASPSAEDGHTLATGDDNGTARLWNVAHPKSQPGDPLTGGGALLSTALRSAPTAARWQPAAPTARCNCGISRPGRAGCCRPRQRLCRQQRRLRPGRADARDRRRQRDRAAVECRDPRAARTLRGHGSGHAAVSSVAFSPDGRTLATGNKRGSVRLWDVATRKPHPQTPDR